MLTADEARKAAFSELERQQEEQNKIEALIKARRALRRKRQVRRGRIIKEIQELKVALIVSLFCDHEPLVVHGIDKTILRFLDVKGIDIRADRVDTRVVDTSVRDFLSEFYDELHKLDSFRHLLDALISYRSDAGEQLGLSRWTSLDDLMYRDATWKESLRSDLEDLWFVAKIMLAAISPSTTQSNGDYSREETDDIENCVEDELGDVVCDWQIREVIDAARMVVDALKEKDIEMSLDSAIQVFHDHNDLRGEEDRCVLFLDLDGDEDIYHPAGDFLWDLSPGEEWPGCWWVKKKYLRRAAEAVASVSRAIQKHASAGGFCCRFRIIDCFDDTIVLGDNSGYEFEAPCTLKVLAECLSIVGFKTKIGHVVRKEYEEPDDLEKVEHDKECGQKYELVVSWSA